MLMFRSMLLFRSNALMAGDSLLCRDKGAKMAQIHLTDGAHVEHYFTICSHSSSLDVGLEPLRPVHNLVVIIRETGVPYSDAAGKRRSVERQRRSGKRR